MSQSVNPITIMVRMGRGTRQWLTSPMTSPSSPRRPADQWTRNYYFRGPLIGENGLRTDHRALGATIQTLGILFATQENQQEAEPLLKSALEINLNQSGVTHTCTALLNTLSSFSAIQCQWAEAERFIQTPLAILEAGRSNKAILK